jgi:hypothetical protein
MEEKVIVPYKVPRSLHQGLKRAAEERDQTISEFVGGLVEEELKKRGFPFGSPSESVFGSGPNQQSVFGGAGSGASGTVFGSQSTEERKPGKKGVFGR